MTKIITDKEKIKQYLENKGISKNKFYLKTGFSVGFLDSGSSLGVDKLRIILNNYSDFNLEWLITGEGEMLKEENAGGHEIEMLLEENNKLKGEVSTLQSKLIACLESRVYPQDNKQTKAS